MTNKSTFTDDEWHALVHPGQKLKPGARLIFEDADRAPGVRIVAAEVRRPQVPPSAASSRAS